MSSVNVLCWTEFATFLLWVEWEASPRGKKLENVITPQNTGQIEAYNVTEFYTKNCLYIVFTTHEVGTVNTSILQIKKTRLTKETSLAQAHTGGAPIQT